MLHGEAHADEGHSAPEIRQARAPKRGGTPCQRECDGRAIPLTENVAFLFVGPAEGVRPSARHVLSRS